MKNSAFTFILLLLFTTSLFSQTIPPDSLYLGQTPPGDSAIIFAPGIISLPGRNEPCITFSSDGKSVFFYIEFYPNPGTPYVMYTNYENDYWTTTDTISIAGGRSTGEPFFAFNHLYMFASNAVNLHGLVDLSCSEKEGNDWSAPVSLGNPPNSESYQYHPCIVGDTSIYFSSNVGYICRSQYHQGVYQNRLILPSPINFVGPQTWGDPFVDNNENYLIFKSKRSGGYGQHDIYISYKKTDGSWTNPKNLGSKINTQYDETSGDITSDGKYMTFGSNKDLFWVSTSFIDSLKYTNFFPYIKNSIPNQTDTIGQLYNYTIPDSTFIDDDGNNTLTYTAKLSNGNSLPSWLSFNPGTRNFSGTPSSIETLNIKVTATDTAGASVFDVFSLNVVNLNAINQLEDHNIEIYPNPLKDEVNISFGNKPYHTSVVKIANINGKSIFSQSYHNLSEVTVDLTDNPSGIYILSICIDGELLHRKICIE